MKNRAINFIVKNQLSLAIASIVFLIVLGLFSRVPSIKGDLSGFNIEDLEQYESGVKIADKFGAAKFIQVNITPNDVKATEVLEYLRNLDGKLNEQIKGIRVQSLHKSNRLLKVGEGSDESIGDVLERAAWLPIVDQIISKDKKSFLMVVFVDSEKDFDLDKFNAIVDKSDPNVKSVNVLSSFHMADAIAGAIQFDLVLLSVLIIVFFSLFIVLTYRSVSALLFSMLIIGTAIFPVFFFFTILDVPMNLITVLVVPVLLVLALADAIHLLTGFRAAGHIESHDEKLKYVLQKYFVPSLITSLTTAVAFFSFQLNSSENIQDFGMITGSAVIIAFIVTFGLGSYLLRFVKCMDSGTHKIAALSRHFVKRKVFYSIGLGAISIVSFFFLSSLKFNTDFESFIPRESRLEFDQEVINKQYYSIYKLDVMIEEKGTNGQNEAMLAVFDLSGALNEMEEIGKVSSYADQYNFKRNNILGKFNMVSFPTKNNPFHTHEFDAFRLDVRVKRTQDLPKVKRFIEDYLEQNSEEYEYTVFSYALMMREMNTKTAQSLLYSLLFSGLFISLLILLMTRSVVYTIVSVIANIVPLSMMILIFYVFDLDLNLLTALTSIVCIGLVVDDTIHVLYRRLILKSELEEVSFGILTTSVILFGGFMMFAISGFRPSQTFGVICAVIFLITVVSDLTLLPYLLDLVSKRKGKV
ncbi:MAG: putative RND superfamily exporter protein [Crocinitomicaceae bacterium]|jgi:predicted RND superfamily exporter protein